MLMLITALFIFIAVLVLTASLGVLSVLTAWVVGRSIPRAREACLRCITGWRTKRGLRNRLLLTPLGITLAVLAMLAVLGLTDTYRVRSAIIDSDRLVVRSGGNCHRNQDREKILYKTDDKQAIETLAGRISLGLSMVGKRCMCCGDMTFDLYRGQELHYSFSLHHGSSIRVRGDSRGDKELAPSSRVQLSNWLDQSGITANLAKAKEDEAEHRKRELEKMDGDAQQNAVPLPPASAGPSEGAR